jgi:hypothetical protein
VVEELTSLDGEADIGLDPAALLDLRLDLDQVRE